jgi:hypothetical protein
MVLALMMLPWSPNLNAARKTSDKKHKNSVAKVDRKVRNVVHPVQPIRGSAQGKRRNLEMALARIRKPKPAPGGSKAMQGAGAEMLGDQAGENAKQSSPKDARGKMQAPPQERLKVGS